MNIFKSLLIFILFSSVCYGAGTNTNYVVGFRTLHYSPIADGGEGAYTNAPNFNIWGLLWLKNTQTNFPGLLVEDVDASTVGQSHYLAYYFQTNVAHWYAQEPDRSIMRLTNVGGSGSLYVDRIYATNLPSIPFSILAGGGTVGLSNITTTGRSLAIGAQFVELTTQAGSSYRFDSALTFVYSNCVWSAPQCLVLNYTNVNQLSAGSELVVPIPYINSITSGVQVTFPYFFNCASNDTIRIHARLSGNPTSGNIYFTNFYMSYMKLGAP